MSAAALKLYFGRELADRLSRLIRPHFPEFPAEVFIDSVTEQVGSLELKGRVAVIADELRKALPADYPVALNILLPILGPENETEEGMFNNGYFLMPIAYFVEKYGLSHFELSMHAMYEITKRHTSEYAIRPYLELHLEDTFERLSHWSRDANLHVRRLVSEGTRPRLPWARRIHAIHGDPANNLVLLEPLWNDPSFYVRKSVANHLNDLKKDYKGITLEWLHEHCDRGGKHSSWMVRHSLRSLIKSEDHEAIALLEKHRGQSDS
ncbi:DNA alkylation repair protein [Paenibacillus mendelii]|uniref:DNA alkylation repair protein n=1 Tax=Paenibacillus mendelii TaxID=206163 RepID=A0ABV6JFV9_9BACL|nr:DNA alkylation repair protein [Paenibacillus mendelii]MCQ6557305.1 DNA alkylation repair protein [Paenibacillus mendelii]